MTDKEERMLTAIREGCRVSIPRLMDPFDSLPPVPKPQEHSDEDYDECFEDNVKMTNEIGNLKARIKELEHDLANKQCVIQGYESQLERHKARIKELEAQSSFHIADQNDDLKRSLNRINELEAKQ